jgi:general L-amino acid transport system permease protein
MWRVGVSVLIFSTVFGVAWGVWGGVARNFALLIAIGLGALAFAPLSLDDLGLQARVWIIANPVAVVLGHQIHRTPLAASRWVIIWALASFVLVLAVLRGVPGVPWLPEVPTGAWGGLLLTFLRALVGIVASFPLGVLLALGRRSNLPVLKGLCVLFIELVRGVPLVSLLFMA